jgi:hypothetical protein
MLADLQVHGDVGGDNMTQDTPFHLSAGDWGFAGGDVECGRIFSNMNTRLPTRLLAVFMFHILLDPYLKPSKLSKMSRSERR